MKLLPVPVFLLTVLPLAAQVPQMLNYQGRVAVNGAAFTGMGQFRFSLVDGGNHAGVPATARARLTNGFVTSVDIGDQGAGFPSAPAISFSGGGGGSGAAAVATVTGGSLTAITVTNAGSGYTQEPTVIIGPPPAQYAVTYWSHDGTGAVGAEPATAVPLSVAAGLYSVRLGDPAVPGMTQVIPASVFANSDVHLRVWFHDGANGVQRLVPDQRLTAVGYAMMAAGVPDQSIGTAQLAPGAVTGEKIAGGAVGSVQMAPGSVTAAQLAGGAVTTTHLAAGAVTAAQIAPGAVGFAGLARPPQSGFVDGSTLFSDFGASSFTVTFPQPYAAAPIVTLAMFTTAATLPAGTGAHVTATTATQFSGSVQVPSTRVVLSTGVNVGFGTVTPSLAMVNARPAIAFDDRSISQLKYLRAADSSGTEWGEIHVLGSVGLGSVHPSLAMVNGNPAISYHNNTGETLQFIRATNPAGSAWGSPVTLDTIGDFGGHTSLAVVNGNPAISYHDDASGDLKFIRANDATGSSWGAPVTVESTGDSGLSTSLLVVNGNPAICYYHATSATVKYVRATNASGTAWGTPLGITAAGAFTFTSMAIVNGNPAVCYRDDATDSIRYVRAANASGTGWGVPVTAGPGSTSTTDGCSLAVVDGNPAISYSAGQNGGFRYVRATDANGNAWSAASIITPAGGDFVSMTVVNGSPAITSYDSASESLHYIRREAPAAFKINWIALPP